MHVTHERIEEIRDELFAHDIPPLPDDAMLCWHDDDVYKYFESNGAHRPLSGFPTEVVAEEVLAPQPPPPPPPPSGAGTYRVVYKPRVAVRNQKELTATLIGSRNAGATVSGVVDNGWLHLDAGGFIMLSHPELGTLLERVDNETATAPPSKPVASSPTAATRLSLQKNVFGEVKTQRKACGANLKITDAAGASRDALFDHFVRQELLFDFQENFRAQGIPNLMYNTDEATDTECVMWCQMGGQLGPLPCKKGQRKLVPGGVRQRVETLGGLRCLVAEKEEGSDEPPLLLVVLAHGIHVLGDDLYGLAYHLARRRVRFVLPGAPELSSEGRPEAMMRTPRQWFGWSPEDPQPTLVPRLSAAARQLATCVLAAQAAAPGAKLVLGGFSQGAAVALRAATFEERLLPRPAAVIQLAAQAPHADLPPSVLDGVLVLVAAGTEDSIAPVASAEKLLAACTAAGALAEPLLRYEGAHEVTSDVALAIGVLLDRLAEADEPNSRALV